VADEIQCVEMQDYAVWQEEHCNRATLLYVWWAIRGSELWEEKDLGIVFSSDMKVALHCRDSYSKANRILGLMSRTMN